MFNYNVLSMKYSIYVMLISDTEDEIEVCIDIGNGG